MAHREMRRSRVLVAAAGLFLGLVLLWLRVGWLQVVRHEHYQDRAERHQKRRAVDRPVRGQLLDRRGRPLARDLITYSVSAAPREMENPRQIARRLARELRLDPKNLASRFDSRPTFLYVSRKIPPELGQRINDLGLSGVYVSLETRRDYVLGDAAAEIVGRTDVDNEGIEGLELQLDHELRGTAGWFTVYQVGNGQTHAQGGRKRATQNGNDVVLSIDADLQAIVESHLTRAIDTLRAERAFALFMDPRTGEILAAVTVPHLSPGRARNWNVTDQIEPGSTFKIVVAAAALEEGVARPDQWFEASANGGVQVAPGAVFTDVHQEAGFLFRDAVRWSSNIVMGKVAVLMGPERLYRYATDMGFGSLSGIQFPGEASGLLRSPGRWSARSAPTIAIGYEVSVTPLQLALAYGVIANGGLLMSPMLVREIRDPEGGVRRFTPHAVRRVLREGTARTLSEFLTAVVDSGTARKARVRGIPVAGKTGTARKYDARTRTYSNQRYVSSFAGFVRADQPSLVGVVVIDEPRGGRYYGGDVAAPVFREIVLDALRLPEGPLHEGPQEIAARPEPPAPVAVPDLRLLMRAAAQTRLRERGLRPAFRGNGSRVLAQQPAAGEAVERGARVVAWLSPPEDSAARVLPDLTGLAAREALRQLSRLEIPARVQGRGVVVRQFPPPGTSLPIDGACSIWCEDVPASASSAWSSPAVNERAGFHPASAARLEPPGRTP